jgi:hypothetical protein
LATGSFDWIYRISWIALSFMLRFFLPLKQAVSESVDPDDSLHYVPVTRLRFQACAGLSTIELSEEPEYEVDALT